MRSKIRQTAAAETRAASRSSTRGEPSRAGTTGDLATGTDLRPLPLPTARIYKRRAMYAPYEDIGEAAITAVLRDLYDRLFDDPLVGFLFAGHDKERIVREQTVFTRRMLGDRTAIYRGRPIPEAHAALPILPGHFDRRHHLLREALERHHVPERVKAIWLRFDAALRPVILKVGRVRIDELRWIDDEESSPPDRE